MTNEFAIDILKQLKDKPTMVNDIDTVEEASWLIDSLDMAIEALEQQSCEDAVSREAVRQLIEADKVDMKAPHIASIATDAQLMCFDTLNQACDRHIEGINSLPSVTPTRPHGDCKEKNIPPTYKRSAMSLKTLINKVCAERGRFKDGSDTKQFYTDIAIELMKVESRGESDE